MTDILHNPEDKLAQPAINMKIAKQQYPYLFTDYHPAKYAYAAPSFIYYYRYRNNTGEFYRIGLRRKIEKVGYEYIGKKKIIPFPYFELEISKGTKTRIYISCGRKPIKPLFTSEGILIND